jgi:hypothetical protein
VLSRCHKRATAHEDGMTKQMSEGQRAYEAKRAGKAGVSLEKWLGMKERERQDAEREREKASKPPVEPKKPGFFGRLLERAHKPL